MKIEGLASLYPTVNKIAANAANGILLSNPGIKKAVSSRRIPWPIAEAFVRAPEVTLAELLTITEVIGSPPIKPETRLPIP